MNAGAPHLVARTRSVDETRDLGAALAAVVRPGDVVVLAGDLGAGKTALVQGVGRGLGVDEPVTSPTFTLVQEYEARLPVYHLDVYRLDRFDEVIDLGLSELLDDEGVVLIEWGDAVVRLLPNDLLEIRLTFGEGEDDRRVEVRGVGRTWAERTAELAAALEPWLDDQTGGAPC